jgi:hypothetical protein
MVALVRARRRVAALGAFAVLHAAYYVLAYSAVAVAADGAGLDLGGMEGTIGMVGAAYVLGRGLEKLGDGIQGAARELKPDIGRMVSMLERLEPPWKTLLQDGLKVKVTGAESVSRLDTEPKRQD